MDALHHNKDLYDAFNAVRAGGESALLNQMLSGINLGGTGAQVVNGTTWTGAMAVRANTTLRPLIANGSAGAFVNQLNTLATGTGVSTSGAILRRAGFARTTSCRTRSSPVSRCWTTSGNSTYHSMQVQFTRRLSNGFTNTTTWTWSKTLGDSDTDAGGNLSRSDAAFD